MNGPRWNHAEWSHPGERYRMLSHMRDIKTHSTETTNGQNQQNIRFAMMKGGEGGGMEN